jgi:hypothetical protein
MIVPIVNRLRPVPIFVLHVVALLPFVMVNVLLMMLVMIVVMMIVMMVLGKRNRANKTRR